MFRVAFLYNVEFDPRKYKLLNSCLDYLNFA